MANMLKEGKTVVYSGQLSYASPTALIPSEIRMTASLSDGTSLFDKTIPNQAGLAKRC